MADKSNIPSELQKATSGPLKFEPQDQETAAAVQSFIQQKSAEQAGAEPVTSQDPNVDQIEQKPIQVPGNPEFDGISPHDASISDALATTARVTVTSLEKEIFLKAVLNDEPVRLPVELYAGQLKVELRSRTTFEQRRVFDVLDKDRVEGVIPADNVALMITRMQCYLAVLMIERINSKLFSDLTLDPKADLDTHCKQLRAAVAKNTEAMQGPRWNSILSALRTFEDKCATMNTEALNEGFWKPQGSA